MDTTGRTLDFLCLKKFGTVAVNNDNCRMFLLFLNARDISVKRLASVLNINTSLCQPPNHKVEFHEIFKFLPLSKFN